MLRKNDTNKIVSIVFGIFLFGAAAYFLQNVFFSFIKPFFLDKKPPSVGVSLDSSLDEVVDYLRLREDLPAGRQDLTGASPSATLIVEENPISVTAEVINGSGVDGAARVLVDRLETIGISVPQVSNSTVESVDTIISLKANAQGLRDTIVEKIGTKSGELRFEVLDDNYPFDIRILIGK